MIAGDMNCPGCHATNRPGAHFCRRCGILLGSHCPRCRQERSADTDFCDNCGLPLSPRASFRWDRFGSAIADEREEGVTLPPVEAASDLRQYTFCNLLTHEAPDNTILLRHRREFHRRVGEALEALFPERHEALAPASAGPFLRSPGQRARPAIPHACRRRGRASFVGLRRGDRSLLGGPRAGRAGRHRDTGVLAEGFTPFAAGRWSSALDTRRSRKGWALRGLGRHDEAREALERARAVAQATGERRYAWRILASLAEIETERADATGAETLLRQAREIIDLIASHAGRPELREAFLDSPAAHAVLESGGRRSLSAAASARGMTKTLTAVAVAMTVIPRNRRRVTSFVGCKAVALLVMALPVEPRRAPTANAVRPEEMKSRPPSEILIGEDVMVKYRRLAGECRNARPRRWRLQ